MSGHTPGPWRLYLGCDVLPPAVQRGDSGGFLVQSTDRARADADARLIAAAPELLDALMKLDEAAGTSDDCCYGTLSTSFVRDIVREAIAKAVQS